MTIKKPQTATIIDTLGEGYAAINRRPWLILVPILLNIYLWFGAQLSFAPLLADFQATLQQLPSSGAEESDFQAQYRDLLLVLSQLDMRQQLTVLNFVPTLTPNVVVPLGREAGLQGLPVVQSMPQMIDEGRSDTIQVASVGGLLLWFVLLNVVALSLSALFLTQTAAAVRGDTAPMATALSRLLHTALAILGYIGVFLLVTLMLGLPFLFFAGLLTLFSQPIGFFMLSLLLIALFWARIYVGFAPEAIAVSGVGPLRAIHASFNIVRRNFWSTLGFLALSFVISMGCGVIWQMLANTTEGLIVAIVGSAYIGSGLIAARMAFYRERLRRWKGALAPSHPLS